MATKLEEITREIGQKSTELHKIFEEAGANMDLALVKSLEGDTTAKASEIKRRNDELTALGKERDALAELHATAAKIAELHRFHTEPKAGGIIFPTAGDGGAQAAPPKSLRQIIDESKEYKAFREGRGGTAVFELPFDSKTLITLSTINVQAQRQDLVAMALEERTVADLMLSSNVSGNAVEYYEETTVTNSAAATAEGATKPESALGYTLRTEPIRKIATYIPATKESLDDVPFLEGQIRGRLAFMIRRIEEAELLNGSGVAPHILGLLGRSGIQTQAKGADPVPDAIYKAMQKVRGAAGAGFAEPTAVVMHPNDWTDVRLLRTADGIYIWGSPAEMGPERIWSLPVRQTTGMTENTALVGAFRPFAEVLRREGIVITVSTEHSTYFIENKIAILAEERIGLAVYRPSAFCTATGV